jgi:hypothetical protein
MILIVFIYTPFIGWENTRAKICGIPSVPGFGTGRLAETAVIS